MRGCPLQWSQLAFLALLVLLLLQLSSLKREESADANALTRAQPRRHAQSIPAPISVDDSSRKPTLPADRLTSPLLRAVQRDPGLLSQDAVAQAFLPVPWLLREGSATTQLLSYLGLHNELDRLLEARSQQIGSYSKAISTVYFSSTTALLLQNWVYTAVKYAGIFNYIVVTWDDASLADCLAMNLPCLNASSYLPMPLSSSMEAQFMSHDFVSINWIKPLLARDLLARGYLVHLSDVDIAFPPKAFWPSMLHFLEPAGADVAMERDLWGPINCGTLVIRPSNRTLAWATTWTEDAARHAAAGFTEQQALAQLHNQAYFTCDGPWDCVRVRQRAEQTAAGAGESLVLVRRYLSAWDSMYQDHCPGGHLDWVSHIDPCMPPQMYYHVICTGGSANKTAAFKATGLWFMDDDSTSGCHESPFGDGDERLEDGGEVEAWWEQGDEGSNERLNSQGQPTVGGKSLMQGRGAGVGAARALKAEQALDSEGPASGAARAAARAVPRCKPLQWRLPRHENAFLRCDRTQVAFVSYAQED